MNKNELVKSIATGANVSPSVASKMLNALQETVSNVLSHGEKVAIRGFGAFMISYRAARCYHHPQSGDNRMARAYCTVRFIPSKNLKVLIS